MDSWDLREARVAQRLTLRQVARAAGTSVPNVSAYERGTKRPNQATLSRILAAVAAGGNSPIHRHGLMTVPRAAATLRGALREGGWSVGDLLRVVRELISNARFAMDRPADRAAFLAEPSTTGDRRWDAMLAGVAEMLALRAGVEVPGWTRGHELGTCWFVGSLEDLHALAFAHSPPSLHARGVLVDPADLEYV